MADGAEKTTACILCECNCGLKVLTGGEHGRHFLRIRGDKEHPISQGYACEKAQRLEHYQHNGQQLRHPLRRRADGTFEQISWEQAISEVASRLARVRDEHGGKSIFYYGGGGQGNHLPGAYATSTLRLLGSRFRSSALAQEKTGEFWVSDRMLGHQTRGDFEHCEVGMFLGKNPWHSHSIARARVTLRELSRDPARTLIVVDPRRTETAELADIHVAVKPGGDAWLLAAILGVVLEEDLVDHAFVDAHTTGFDAVREAVAAVDIQASAKRAGVPESQVRLVARTIAGAASFACFEDLGVQMNRHSTLVSYLERLVWMSTGHYARPGTHFMPIPMVPFATGANGKTSPVLGAPIISGLVPCNVIAEEILTDHPDRYRAMIVEAANPAHSLADSRRMREALGALDTLVVIDVAMSETARLADYVLPASTQFEKAEATFFNFEFPHNAFHLRRRLFTPREGPLPEAEIHARLGEALGAFEAESLTPLHAAAKQGVEAYVLAFLQHALPHPKLSKVPALVLYRTLGPALPEESREGAVLLGLVLRCAMKYPDALARAGFAGPPHVAGAALFQAILDQPSGVVFSVGRWQDVRPATADGRIQLELEDLLEVFRGLDTHEETSELPFVLSAGERRSYTANTIFRDPQWRKKDAGGALRMSPGDASELGVGTGDRVRLSTRSGEAVVTVEVSDTMQDGHVSLPNGHGLSDGAGGTTGGVAPNELTASEDRDPFVGTPWHKAVPAQIAVV
jgi:anaerobic selenocysteine-containing dehydrogenase